MIRNTVLAMVLALVSVLAAFGMVPTVPTTGPIAAEGPVAPTATTMAMPTAVGTATAPMRAPAPGVFDAVLSFLPCICFLVALILVSGVAIYFVVQLAVRHGKEDAAKRGG